MRRFLAPVLLILALAACGSDDKPIIHPVGDTTTTAATVTTVTTVTTEPVVTTEPEPTTTTALVPGSENDPDGPILCPGLRHPAHHRPCPAPAPAVTSTPSAPTSTGSATASPASGSLAAIVECEDNDNPAAGPTGYASNTGNGYYGGYQWLPSTFRVALGQALAQGRISQAVYDANVGRRPDLVESWIQDAAAAAHIAAGNRGAWPNC